MNCTECRGTLCNATPAANCEFSSRLESTMLVSPMQRSSTVHSLVDAFFESKKTEMKQQLRVELDRVVDNLFGALVATVKELLIIGDQNKSTEAVSLNRESLVSKPLEAENAVCSTARVPKMAVVRQATKRAHDSTNKTPLMMVNLSSSDQDLVIMNGVHEVSIEDDSQEAPVKKPRTQLSHEHEPLAATPFQHEAASNKATRLVPS